MKATINAQVMEFFKLVPVEFKCVIAGGAAIQGGIHAYNDVDLWLLGRPEPKDVAMHALRTRINSSLARFGAPGDLLNFEWDATEAEFVGGPGGGPNEASDSTGVDFKGRKLFAGVFQGIKFQIMGTEATTTQELLGNFDLSICQWALERPGLCVNIESSTVPGQEVHITNRSTPEHTFKRLRKYIKRFGIGCAPDAIDLLSLALAGENLGQSIQLRASTAEAPSATEEIPF